MRNHGIRVYAISAVVLLLMTGCTLAEKVVLTYARWEAAEPGRKALIEAFNRSQDEIEVVYRDIGFGKFGERYVEKLTVEIAAGQGPDLLGLMSWPNAPMPIYTWAKSGVLRDLTPYLERDKQALQVNQWPSFVLNRVTYAGHVVGLPYGWTVFGTLAYNRQLFSQAGMAYPDSTWTWEDLAGASKRLLRQDADGRITQWGLATNDSSSLINWRQMDAMIVAAGGSMFNDQQSALALRSEPAQRVMNSILDHVFANDYRLDAPGWTTNKVGLLLWQVHNAAAYGTRMRVGELPTIDMALAVSPMDPITKLRKNHSEIAAIAINGNTAHPDAAWEFMKYMSMNYARVWKSAEGVLKYPPLLPKEMRLFFSPDGEAAAMGIFETLPEVLPAMADTAILQTPVINQRAAEALPEAFSVLTAEWQKTLRQQIGLSQFLDNVERQINPKL